MPKYTVTGHRSVIKFLAELREEAVKERIKEAIGKLVDAEFCEFLTNVFNAKSILGQVYMARSKPSTV